MLVRTTSQPPAVQTNNNQFQFLHAHVHLSHNHFQPLACGDEDDSGHRLIHSRGSRLNEHEHWSIFEMKKSRTNGFSFMVTIENKPCWNLNEEMKWIEECNSAYHKSSPCWAVLKWSSLMLDARCPDARCPMDDVWISKANDNNDDRMWIRFTHQMGSTVRSWWGSATESYNKWHCRLSIYFEFWMHSNMQNWNLVG